MGRPRALTQGHTSETRTILALTSLLATLALTPTAATAFFEANGTNTSQGPYQLSGSQTFSIGGNP